MNKLLKLFKTNPLSKSIPVLTIFFIFCVPVNAEDAILAKKKKKSDWIESPGSAAANKTVVDSKTGTVTLKLGVAHSSHVKPIPFKLQVGEIFDESILKQRSRLFWYRIPEWLAGKWKRERECIISTFNYQTQRRTHLEKSILSEQIADWGVQRDAEDGIWHTNLSMRGVSNRGSFRSVALVRKQLPVIRKKTEIVFKEEFVVLHVMKGTNAIMESSIVESLTKYKPIKRGLLETTMSVQVYRADGEPKTQQENLAFDRMLEAYSSVDQYKGMDVHQDFVNYLRSRNLDELVPD